MSRQIKFQFLKPGFHTLVVDSSTQGYQKSGVPIGGAMDSVAAKMANWLVGNKQDEPLFEITLIGPQIIFKEKCQIALTGADMSPTVDGFKVKMYETITISKGSLLTFGKLVRGCRLYLSIRGKWAKQDWLNVKKDQLLKLNSTYVEAIEPLTSTRKNKKQNTFKDMAIIKVLKGPEFKKLPDKVKNALFLTTFTLLQDSNRMGYRLSPKLPAINQSIISSGVVPGTLQITKDGFPILLMKDTPATGGYVRALNVISKDISKLGQLKPGDRLSFQLLG